MNSDVLYSLSGVGKQFEAPGGTIDILKGIDLDICCGESVSIIGASGSGKTTLLHLLGTLDTPSSGIITYLDDDLTSLSQREKARLRNEEIGFVFQFHHLLPEFNAVENVSMPMLIRGESRKMATSKAMDALQLVGLTDRASHNVTTLSGGERQRTAIARAIVSRPRVLLADEPTGSLDEKTGQNVGELLLQLNRELAMTLVIVTHNMELARNMGSIYELHSGVLNVHDPEAN